MSCERSPVSHVPIVAIIGPTASGKTGLSLDLAERLGGEIVNTDAMQVYRGMDIGTAKLPLAERRGIRHHLLDTLEIGDPATVATFQEWARVLIEDLRAAGTPPILVGGSALYTRALLDRFEFPATDPDIRSRLEADLAEVGAPAMYDRLARIDPEAASRMSPVNGRRTVRALEVIEITGEPYSASLPELTYSDPHTVQIGIDIDRPTLDARIERRVQHMFDEGFVAEVERLLAAGLAEGRTASRAIGYREVTAHLAGDLTLAEAQERTVIATRQFARRQLAWWRKDPRIRWLVHDDPDLAEKATALVRALDDA